MRIPMLAMTLAAVALPSVPALAQDNPRQANREYNREVRQANREYKRDVRRAASPRDIRQAQRERNREVRDARQDRREDIRDWRQYRNYSYNRFEPGQNRYYADRYYRQGNYRPLRVTRSSRVYRGSNGSYYCRRSDGTTGLIVGAAAGGILGNLLSNGQSNILGTLLGAGAGGALGSVVDSGRLICR
ncbi:glycine zipper 2TM domain-containing protein [Sphingomonas japonica]|uniref:17 kDa surface antigen n=1 Tax=Sphingomonas japonica TaxID=511662 RepID=A0ABX0U374_9SPHN|nr:glycine zipper 2TM domain-containing protein [Sphingomonas japonica]NIJ23222.1 type II secretory pathway pseudopilin PulG [Sphingomonas japonica]